MTEVQTEAAFQSLAEELSRLSHAPPLTPSEHQHELDEGCNSFICFGSSRRCARMIFPLCIGLMMALLALQDEAGEQLHPTH